MSRFNIVYNEFSQQFITLPLTIKNISGEDMIVNSIHVQNIVTNNPVTDNDILFYFDETYSNYTEAEILYTSTYNVNHSGFNFVNQTQKKRDKINYIFVLPNDKEFNFLSVFNPNISKYNVRKGGFKAKITINIFLPDSSYNETLQYNLEGDSNDKIVAKIQNIPYTNIKSIFETQRSQIINLN
tara:strand:- start:1046 stop:1597 length:552 start_codon:yes stop_codon:yes gene_type:complete